MQFDVVCEENLTSPDKVEKASVKEFVELL